MPELWKKINEDLKQAMKNRQAEELGNLRMLLSALKNKKIDLKQADDLSDEQVIAVIASEIKKRKDSAEAYRQGNRLDLVEKEEAEISILAKYQQEQMSSEDIEKALREMVAGIPDASPAKLGVLMGQAMQLLKGKAEGNAVRTALQKILGQ